MSIARTPRVAITRRHERGAGAIRAESYLGPALRQAAGGMPNSRLNARLKAASDS
jgi:hypothetical protein